jgi:hypothetical protein
MNARASILFGVVWTCQDLKQTAAASDRPVRAA